MPRVSNIEDVRLNLRYGFCFDIQDFSELMCWWMDVRIPHFRVEFSDAIRSGFGTRGHPTEGAVLTDLCRISGRSLIEQLQYLGDRQLRGMMRTLEDTGGIFIQRTRSYLSRGKDIKILETRTVDNWVIPGEEGRIMQWPGGKHYYAKVGNLDVVVNKQQKWDTREEAEEAIREFLRREN